ncbi:hypothetical protein IJ21_09910 [Paenibacillus sp. 32O-W]|uniref:hypothetical protein n=1 Tax=Paenibacillus sp. 32O-W TaxID=1695218 RepID=UPI00071F0632|nr:hypothetical protein [Paenibacillus sp. 32O-W]ALS26400.1 hypothetical protein IJ21_09910 [Paenibacillus sp. 32O-W]
MNKYKALLYCDMRNAARDPMLLLILAGPLLLVLTTRLGMPPLSNWIADKTGYDLLAYKAFISLLIQALIPQLIGAATGLLMLDERDERIIDCYAVTPLRKRGYIVYRLILPVGICCGMSLLFVSASGISGLTVGQTLPLLLFVLEAPLFALFLVAFAANKVEGLALSKLISMTLLGPACAYFVAEPWQWLAGLLPTYWPSKLYLELAAADNGWQRQAIFAIGLSVHLLLLYGLLRRFVNRME